MLKLVQLGFNCLVAIDFKYQSRLEWSLGERGDDWSRVSPGASGVPLHPRKYCFSAVNGLSVLGKVKGQCLLDVIA